jgi:hypothetical protein
MCTQKSTDGSNANTSTSTISTEKIFIENSHSIYSDSWDVITEHLNNLKDTNLYCFAEDKTYFDKKTKEQKFIYNYYALDYESIYELSIQKKYHLYETYEAEQKIKLFLDIDIPISKVPDDYKKKKVKYLDKIINNIIDLINDNLTDYNEDIKPNIIILKSCNESKLSSHIIYQNVVFDDVYHIRYFLSQIKSSYIDNKILDPNVYRKGCFRMLWNSKIKKNVNLEYDTSINYDYMDDKTLFYDCLLRNISKKSYKINLDIPKLISTKKINKTIQNKINEQNIFNDLYSVNYLKRYLDILNPKRKEDYKEWIEICICIFNCNSTIEGFNLWHKWSQSSDNYVNKQDCINQWNIISNRKYNYGIGTLKYYAKLDNPDKYEEIEASNDLPIYNSIKFNKPYLLNKKEEHIYDDNTNIVCKNIIDWYKSADTKTLCIKSCYNSGKTKILERIFEDLNFKRILFISYRQSLTNDIYGNFEKYKFKSYLDKIYDSNRVVCQIESLYKLESNQDTNIPDYDLVIMDESESLLNHFRSDTIKEKEKTFDLMKNIIFNSKKLLMLDGDCSNRSYTYCDYFGKSIILENECKKDKKHMIYTNHRKYFEQQIENDLKVGLKIIICSMSSKLASHYNKLYKDTYKTILHCSDSDDALKENLKDVKNFWKLFQLLIYSPSIESGVNFDMDHFDKIYVVLSTKSTSQRGLLQMMGRVRKLKDYDILVYLNNIPYSDKISFYKYDEIKKYVIETNMIEMKMILDPKTNKMVRTYDFDLYNKILTHNIQEDCNKNKNIFVKYFNYLLTIKGYTYECLDCKINKNNIVRENVLLNEIINAKDITGKELQDLLNKQANNEATHEDKIMIERYMAIKKLRLDEIELNDIDEDDYSDSDEDNKRYINNLSEKIEMERNIRNNALAKYYCNITKVENLRLLNNKIDDNNDKVESNDNDSNKKKEIEYDKNASNKKLNIIIDVTNKLGYEDVSDKKLIERTEFETNMNKVIKESELFTNPHLVNPLFGLNKKVNKVESIRSFMGFINSLFNEFGFNIKLNKKSVKINKKKTNKYFYYIKFVNEADKFV